MAGGDPSIFYKDEFDPNLRETFAQYMRCDKNHCTNVNL